MPLRRLVPRARDMRLYRRIDYGRLLRFNVLDTRQYRDDQAAPGSTVGDDRRRTLMGKAPGALAARRAARLGARWNVVAQQIFFAQRDRKPGPESGCPATRGTATRPPRAGDAGPWPIRAPPTRSCSAGTCTRTGPTTCWPTTAIPRQGGGHRVRGHVDQSGGDGDDQTPEAAPVLGRESAREVLRTDSAATCDVTSDESEWRTDYRVVPYVSRPGAPVSTRASAVVKAGEPGLSVE